MEKQRKILYIITKGSWGGAQRYVYDLASNLPTSVFEPLVAMGGGSALASKLAEVGVKTIILPSLKETRRAGPQTSDLFAFVEIIRLLRAERPNIVHLNSSRVALLGTMAVRVFKLYNALTAKRYRIQTVFTIHGWPFKEPRHFIIQNILWCASYVTALLSDILIAVSQDDYRLTRYMPGILRKTTHIPNGVGPLSLYTKDEALSHLIPQPGTKTPFVVGTIGEVNRNKGHRYLLEAIVTLSPSVMACIIGDGPEKTALIALAKSLKIKDRVRFVSGIEDASRYLSAFDIFVFPSLKEGLPYALLEAGGAGCPVIASDIPGNREIIAHKELGVLVPPGNAEGLAHAITTLMNNKSLRDQNSVALKKYVNEQFPLKRMVEQTIGLYT